MFLIQTEEIVEDTHLETFARQMISNQVIKSAHLLQKREIVERNQME
jgi:hypothetical protein